MAFNFKWSPLAADTSFYSKAKELLTEALNKSPKPPIIVDDIVVTELYLGEIPPDLEVLEIGDLDVDRFRGMFKMCYSGNASLTLKTRVQANPLNTYLTTRPTFTSPQPLAAAAGLTIPIQITLSEIRLSAFIMLVYASQKGITLVFRNDPLESLKVSSTFDAIPFVREYLQREIESQLRSLLMDELPLIIHRLSLRFFNKDIEEKENNATTGFGQEETLVDPLSSPPQDPVDSFGNVLDAAQITSLSLEPGSESQALFSQRNLLRLGALTESHRTLSLFTPTLRDTVFRASSGSYDRGEAGRFSHKPTPALSRSHSYAGSFAGSHTMSDSPTDTHFSSRHGLQSGSGASSTNLSRYNKPGGRKKRHRVINLRKKAMDHTDDNASISGSSAATSAEGAESIYSAPSQFDGRPKTPEKEPGDMEVHRVSPGKRASTPPKASQSNLYPDPDQTPRQSQYLPQPARDSKASDVHHTPRPDLSRSRTLGNPEKSTATFGASSSKAQAREQPLKQLDPVLVEETSRGPPAQQFEQSAWMNRIADEILRKVHERKAQDSKFWDRRGSSASSVEEPPPAYGS